MLSTKIICTIGPASDSPEILAELAEAGMNVARLNFSHGTHDSHKKIIEQIHELNRSRQFPIAILLDTQGPEIRTGNETATLNSKDIITVSCPPYKENEGNIHVNYSALKSDLKPGSYISIDSGLVKLKVLGKNKKGFIPVVSNAPKDHHSLLQLYLDGPKDKIFYVFSSKIQENLKLNFNFF